MPSVRSRLVSWNSLIIRRGLKSAGIAVSRLTIASGAARRTADATADASRASAVTSSTLGLLPTSALVCRAMPTT